MFLKHRHKQRLQKSYFLHESFACRLCHKKALALIQRTTFAYARYRVASTAGPISTSGKALRIEDEELSKAQTLCRYSTRKLTTKRQLQKNAIDGRRISNSAQNYSYTLITANSLCSWKLPQFKLPANRYTLKLRSC